jgi:hypothetical protein
MHVRVDDIADRQRRDGADRGAQVAAFLYRAAGVDYRYAALAHDEADVCDIALVFTGCEGVLAAVDVEVWGELGYRERGCRGCRACAEHCCEY